MDKALSEMTLQELWDLFPIVLKEHDEAWSGWYCEEKQRLLDFLPMADRLRIDHIGSTAIDGIWAKPIIDILVEIPDDVAMEDVKKLLAANGYICMSEKETRMSFNRGYTSKGFAERVFHLHLRRSGDNDELYFRDYLNEHYDVAKRYEELKLLLWEKYVHDRDGYTNAKSSFVTETTNEAKKTLREKILYAAPVSRKYPHGLYSLRAHMLF